METNFFGLWVCVLQVTLAYESIVLCMCSGNVLNGYVSFLLSYLHTNTGMNFQSGQGESYEREKSKPGNCIFLMSTRQ